MKQRRTLVILGPLLLLALALVAAGTASAQTTTGRIQGIVRDAQGAALPGATVTATNPATGLKRTAVTGVDGGYSLILPPGNYQVTASTPAHEEQRATITLQVGQLLDNDFSLKPGKMVASSVSVSVEAEPEVELRTTEIATNVSQDTIAHLPTSNRNFLSAAIFAPGMRMSHDDLRQESSYGAQGAVNTNVFIDGTSYKNDVLQGGVVGQDSSRGNPFPQNAVQEYRVITQNYKAEYQKASSAIISAVTKSGSNEFHGDAFLYYQDKAFVGQDKFSKAAGLDKPEYTRWQPGVSFGGPLARDSLFFFASYEGNYQDREYSVLKGGDMNWPASFRSQFDQYVGNYTSPFRASLVFAKGSALLSPSSTLDVSGDWRHETDIRDFGNQQSYENANDIKNDIWTVRGRHSLVSGNYVNEATLSYQQYEWNPTPINFDIVGQDFQGLMRIGGKDTTQDFTQKRFAIRDDLTYMGFRAAGEHVLKGGVTADFLSYDVVKQLYGNPVYNYRAATYITTAGDMPFQALYGVGNPDLSTNNQQIGLYLQDDWRINPRLTANIGLRWDFETDMLNNDYVTPAEVVAGLGTTYPSNYFTDGTQRPIYYGAIQPRIGLSYDITGDGKTVVFGGYGRYFDRTLYNDILDEKYRLQYEIRTFWFSEDGSPQDGRPAIKWDPAYLTKEGLDSLIAQGIAPAPEVYLLNNDTRPPSSDQFSAGIRKSFDLLNVSLSYQGVYSKNQMTWTCGIKAANGSCDWGARPDPDLGFSLLSRGKKGWYHSANVVLEKPFTASSKWGAFFSYAYGDAQQTGNDLFSWGTLDPINENKQRSNIAQQHQFVASGTVALPLDFRFTTLLSFGSGFPFYVTDCSAGYDKCVESIGGGDPPKWNESIDFRLEKAFTFGNAMALTLIFEGINIFNYQNEQGYDGWIPALPDVNTHFGQASSTYNPSRFQFGARFSF